MPHIGGPELILILVVLFLFFGASKLPQAGAALGQGLKNFKKAMNGEDEVDVTPKKKKKDAALASSNTAEEEDEEEEAAETAKAK